MTAPFHQLFIHYVWTTFERLLVGEVKGASSHFMNHEMALGHGFKWQNGYGAFTVSKRGVPTVAEYVRNQKTHHAEGRLIAALERTEENTTPSG